MKVLIVVDMLNDFIDPEGALFLGDKARRIIPFVKERIGFHQSHTERIVIYLNDSHKEDDKEFARFPKHAITGTWGANVIPECMAMSDDKIFEKTRYSGFFHTPLKGLLYAIKEWFGIEYVEVVGVCTSICVMDTVAGLANRDVENIIVPMSGVADFDSEMHEFALKRMGRIYGANVL